MEDHHWGGQCWNSAVEPEEEEEVLPDFPTGAIIVMENASYCSFQRNKCPTMACRKWGMTAWLQHSNITFGDILLKTAQT
jgi:hypothetical protein